MRKNIMLVFSMLILSSCGSSRSNQQNVEHVNYKPITANYTSSAAKSAAVTGMSTFIGDDWANWGFASANEFASAQLGTPYPDLALTNPGKSNQMVIAGNNWLFPVMVNDEYRCMLRVVKINNQWQTVSLIGNTFASLIQTAEKNHPALNLRTKGIVSYVGTSILVLNPSENEPSFIFLLPFREQINKIPQYSGWVNTDPVPALTFEELFVIFEPSN